MVIQLYLYFSHTHEFDHCMLNFCQLAPTLNLNIAYQQVNPIDALHHVTDHLRRNERHTIVTGNFFLNVSLCQGDNI